MNTTRATMMKYIRSERKGPQPKTNGPIWAVASAPGTSRDEHGDNRHNDIVDERLDEGGCCDADHKRNGKSYNLVIASRNSINSAIKPISFSHPTGDQRKFSGGIKHTDPISITGTPTKILLIRILTAGQQGILMMGGNGRNDFSERILSRRSLSIGKDAESGLLENLYLPKSFTSAYVRTVVLPCRPGYSTKNTHP